MKQRIFYSSKPKLTVKDIAAFSKDEYVCKCLLQTKRGQPVAVSQHSDPDCGIWRVQHGFSCVYFGTYSEAMAYCRDRFCDLSGNPLRN
jgi:hypothetical protein